MIKEKSASAKDLTRNAEEEVGGMFLAAGFTETQDKDIDAKTDYLDDNTQALFRKITEEPQLSPREYEIARLVAKGLPNKTVAAILDISPWTVATHLRRMFSKLGVRSRTAMIAHLFEHGSHKHD